MTIRVSFLSIQGREIEDPFQTQKKLSIYVLVHIHSFPVCCSGDKMRQRSALTHILFPFLFPRRRKSNESFPKQNIREKNILLLSLAGKKGKYALCSNTLNFLKSRLFLSLSVCPAPACCVGIGAALTIVSLPAHGIGI